MSVKVLRSPEDVFEALASRPLGRRELYEAVDGTYWITYQGGLVPNAVLRETLAMDRLQRAFPERPDINCWVLKAV